MNTPPNRWNYEYISEDLFLASRISKVIYSGKSKYQDISIIDTVPFGRCLILDGRTQSSEADEFVYHEALIHPGLTSICNPNTAFIAGGAEGATLREILSHKTIQRVVMVDLDKDVVDLCRKYLPNHHQGSFNDPKLSLIHEDAFSYLENHSDKYDFIVLDISDPLEKGPAYPLYTKEFYELVMSRLNTYGLLVVQAGPCGPLNYNEVFTAINHTMSSVFPMVFPYRAYIPSFGSSWGFIIGSKNTKPTTITPEQINNILENNLSRTLRFYDGDTHHGLFALPKYIRQAIIHEKRIITKENPLFAE